MKLLSFGVKHPTLGGLITLSFIFKTKPSYYKSYCQTFTTGKVI